MSYPIPKDALDDRLAIVGTAGSGKTYLTLGAIEHLFARKSRVIGIDPLGVMWGLRLCEDGKTPSPFQPVIFGGAHGDLPINEHAGALIGETVATMRESCIIDLSALGTKASERRFMLAFLTALYRHTDKEPVHLIIDEADMFAPQKLLDKDGDAAKLLGMMETVVRRGRVRGFIPWLITQRPQVLSKDILSQADGLIALKLTGSHDRGAIRAWVESTADQGQWKTIDGKLPTYQRGEGVVWIPARGILSEATFPPKATFDSSRTPKRGEKRTSAELKPLDLTALKDKLGQVETEAKANDPKALKAEIAKLRAEIGKSSAAKPVPLLKDEAAALRDREAAFADGKKEGFEEGWRQGWIKGAIDGAEGRRIADIATMTDFAKRIMAVPSDPPTGAPRAPRYVPEPSRSSETRPISSGFHKPPSQDKRIAANGDCSIKPALQRALDAIAWWRKIGFDPIERDRAAVVAGYSPKASTFGVYIGELVQMGLVVTSPGKVALTEEGLAIAHTPEAATEEALKAHARGLLKPQEQRVFDVIYDAWPQEIARDQVAEAVGLSPTASTCGVYIGAVAAYGIVEPGSRGHVRAADWLFPEAR